MNNILRIKNFVLAHEFLETSSTQLSQDFLFITIYNLFCAKYSVPLFWTFKVRFDFDLKWQITFFTLEKYLVLKAIFTLQSHCLNTSYHLVPYILNHSEKHFSIIHSLHSKLILPHQHSKQHHVDWHRAWLHTKLLNVTEGFMDCI